MLAHVWNRYAKPLDMPIYVYENGYPVEHEASMDVGRILKDTHRQEFYDLYIGALCDVVVKQQAKIQGYHCWSLLE